MIIPKMPAGCYAHPLANFLVGTTTINKAGVIKATLAVEASSLESPYNDVRALLSPEQNGLVPVLVFIDQKAVKVDETPQKIDETVARADGDVASPGPVYGLTSAPETRNDPAVAAIQFALKTDDGLTWLRLWNEGEFEACRKEWLDSPAACFIGADQFFVPPSSELTGDGSGEALPPVEDGNPLERVKRRAPTQLPDLLKATGAVDAVIDKLVGVKEEFIVVVQRVGAGFQVSYSWDGARMETREAAIKVGLEDVGSDDFNIGVVKGLQMVDFGWMEESLGEDAETLADIARQIGLKP